LYLPRHAWAKVVRAEFVEVCVLRLPVEQHISFVSLVANAKEYKQLSQENTHVENEGRYNRPKLRV